MENNSAQNIASPCANGCGFYGHPHSNNMCSKCFKELNKKNGTLPADSNTAATTTTSIASTPALLPGLGSDSSAPSTPAPTVFTPTQGSGASTPTSIGSSALESLAPGERPPQVNKGRCYLCRAKIPLAKQAINKCRCDFVFCDGHKATDKHGCDFDFAKMGKDLLTKNNPKLNDKPRGGRSFTRIQE